MSTNFPSGTDSFTNPSGGDTTTSPSHADQHTNINDAMEAVQNNLGTNGGTAWAQFLTAGQFPARVTGGGATGTVVQTLVAGSHINTFIGTSQITGGTISSSTLSGNFLISGGTLANNVIGTPAITGGTFTSPTFSASAVVTAAIADGAVTTRKVAPTFLTGTITSFTTTVVGTWTTCTGNQINVGSTSVPTASRLLVWTNGRVNHSAGSAIMVLRFTNGTTNFAQTEIQLVKDQSVGNGPLFLTSIFSCPANTNQTINLQVFNRNAGTFAVVDGEINGILISQ